MRISAQDHTRIAAALRQAETGTSGEIVCVLAPRSVTAAGLPVALAALVALALPWLLIAVTQWPVSRILLLQLLCFVVGVLALSPPRIRTALVPRRLRRAQAHRLAAEQFHIRRVARTRERTGILIFVSLAERYVRIIADDGIAARVAQAEWEGAVQALSAHLREGRIADGFVQAIERCGVVLHAHVPAARDDRNELPDRLYVLE